MKIHRFRKIIGIVLAAVMMFSATVATADSPIKLYLNGVELRTDVAPVIVNDRTMVPIRIVSENLKADVEWDAPSKTAIVMLNEKTLLLTVGSTTMHTDDGIVTLDAAPFIQNDRTMVPIRVVCEFFGCDVKWNAETRSVIIREEAYSGPDVLEPAEQPEGTGPQVTVDSDAYFAKDSSQIIEQATSLINDYRTREGLNVLIYSKDLESVVYNHCKDMADNDYIDHTSPDGVTFNQRLDNAGITYSIAAENIATGINSVEKVVESWMNSPSHRNNLLNPNATKIGIGYYTEGPNAPYWTAVVIVD